MKEMLTIFLLLVGGCQAFSQVQIDLLTQTRRGVEIVRNDLQDKSQIIRSYHALQRKRIDDAFDADVLERPTLSADWVIEQRKAYAAALDAVTSAEIASAAANLHEQENLNAVDQALQRVIWLQSAQLRLTSLPKEIKP